MKFTHLDLEYLREVEAECFRFSPTLNIIIVPPDNKIPLIRSLQTLLCRSTDEDAKKRFLPYSLTYQMKSGEEYNVSFRTGHQRFTEADRQLLQYSDTDDSFPESALAISAILFSRIVFPLVLPPSLQYISTPVILNFMDSLQDESLRKPLQKAVEELQYVLKSLGDDDDAGTPLGRMHSVTQDLERELRESEERKSTLITFSSKLQELQEKQKKLVNKEKSLREQLSGEKEKKALEKWIKLQMLEQELAGKEIELESCRIEKEKITEKASAYREKIKQKDALLSLSVDLNVLIQDYENMGVALCSSNSEKEKLLLEMSEKEVELNNKIEICRPVFGRFTENETFESHIDAIESELSKTRIMNDKKELYHNAQKRRDGNRRVKFLFFIPALILTVLLLAASIFTFSTPIPFPELFLPVVALLCVFLFYESLKFFTLQRKDMRDMKSAGAEISVLKSSIDEAKSALAVLQKELGVVTTTDIRNRFHEWIGIKRDLESLHRVKELHSMVKSRLDTEKTKLETDIRAIMKQCDTTPDDAPITADILIQLKKEYIVVRELQTDLDTLGKQYRSISDRMIEIQEARAAVKKEIQGFTTSRDSTGEVSDLNSVINAVSTLEETELVISEYEEELKEQNYSLHALQKSGRDTVEIEEELLYNEKKWIALKKKQNALVFAAGEIAGMEQSFIDRVFTPFFTSFALQFFDTHFPSEDQTIYKSMLDRIISKDPGPAEAEYTEIEGLINFLLSLMIRHSFSSVITKDLESLPLLIDLDKLSGFRKVGRFSKGLESMIALSKWTQLFFLTEEQSRAEYLEGIVVSGNTPCIFHKTPQMSLITAEELSFDDV
ncbi:MAG: hypothetical protein AB2L14_14700 [Candidatus Xenobiia bacterium LiM19]